MQGLEPTPTLGGTDGNPGAGAEDTPSTPPDDTPPSDESPPAGDSNPGGGDGGNGPTPCDIGQFGEDGCERAQTAVDLVNEFRISQGLEGNQCLNNKLMAAAKKHSEYLFSQRQAGHGEDDPARKKSKQRMNQEGFFATPMSGKPLPSFPPGIACGVHRPSSPPLPSTDLAPSCSCHLFFLESRAWCARFKACGSGNRVAPLLLRSTVSEPVPRSLFPHSNRFLFY